jgi:hypothetical protein
LPHSLQSDSSRRRHLAHGLLWVAALCVLMGSGCEPECGKTEDCILSKAATAYGGCAPLEYWCDSGACKATCQRPCKVVMPDFDPCPAGSVCAQPTINHSDVSDPSYFCTAFPIPCGSADDCPPYTPNVKSGADAGPAGSPGVWSCDNGFCRFPGFSYMSAQ